MAREKQVPIPSVLADDSEPFRAWVIASAMPKATRAEVIAACVKMGIDEGVAASQVQRQRFAQKAAIKARTLPKGVRRMIERAAATARSEARAD